METVSYPLRIPSEIVALAKLRAKEEYVDQATALRQLLYLGAEEYVVCLVASHRISIGRAAELLNISIQDVQRFAEKQGVTLGPTSAQQRKSKETMKKLLSQ